MVSLHESHVQFILLAEFDIDKGAVIAHQYPHKTGTEEQILAELMLPDGVQDLKEDWTVFFLNQSSANAVIPHVPAGETPPRAEDTKQDLVYVLNLVRTKHDKTVRRGALVKAMAICTHHPYIQIFKPVLLIALDDYFATPTVDCLANIFNTLNSLDLSLVPVLTRHEKLVMRVSDRKDIFAEKFSKRQSRDGSVEPPARSEFASDSTSTKFNNSSEMLAVSNSSQSRLVLDDRQHNRTDSSVSALSFDTAHTGGAWVGDDTSRDNSSDPTNTFHSMSEMTRSRDDLVIGSSESGHLHKRRPLANRDTHFYETVIKYGTFHLPIKVPVSSFPEEVGDFSLIELIQTFSAPTATVTGPLHPHLHTNGPATHPVILLFNAIITQKRVLFVGHRRPAGQVSNFVLAACALASGSGCYLRGFTERAFPYINLSTKDILEPFTSTGWIAGATNPIFENMPMWDILCNIVTGNITIHKDVTTPAVAPSLFPAPPPIPSVGSKTGMLKSEGLTDDEFGRNSLGGATTPISKEYVTRQDSYDVLFMEEILASISYHVGEAAVRARFAEYVSRFIQLAARYEEDTLRATSIGHPCTQFNLNARTGVATLGSGIRFSNDITGLRELSSNGSRIEGWRKSASYEYWVQDFQSELDNSQIKGFDLDHQVLRLRNGRSISDSEVGLILKTICENVQNYDQVVELLSYFPPQHGGLQPIALCLFHQQEYIRDMTVNLFNVLRDYTVGFQALQALNQFFRYSYIRQAHERQLLWKDGQGIYFPTTSTSRTPSQKAHSNHSQASLGGL